MDGLFEDVMLIFRAHLCWYPKYLTRCSAFEPLNLSIHQRCAEGRGVGNIADIKYYCQYLTRCLAFEPLNLTIHQGIGRGQGIRGSRRLQISHPISCLRTPEPYNYQGIGIGAGDSGISPISNIIVNISPDVLLSNPWTFQIIKAVQRAGGSGISQISNIIANISLDVLSSNPWTFQYLKAVQRAGESEISPMSNIFARIYHPMPRLRTPEPSNSPRLCR